MDDDAPARKAALLRRAVQETRVVLEKASQAFQPFTCPGSAECCQLSTTRRPPWLWPTEWALLEAELVRQRRALPPVRSDGGCRFLDPEGRRCTVYEARPFGCRTFFCERIQGPPRMPVEATDALLSRLERVNVEWDDEAQPRPLPEYPRPLP
jgi:Fe-S-cluster containining protein